MPPEGRGPPAAEPRPAPNVVWILADDLGWRDLGFTGSALYETPNIDRLARAGVYFSQFDVASPVCSPTRASLMTGKHPARLGLTKWIGGGRSDGTGVEHASGLSASETTIGERFREAGYATAYIGKWHLGGGEFLPNRQGFDTVKGVNAAGQPATYFYPYHSARRSGWDVPGLEGGHPGEYLTDRLTDEAIAFFAQHASEPFFVVLSHYAVHRPLEAKPALEAKFREKCEAAAVSPEFVSERGTAVTKVRQDDAVYAAMVASLDESVGRVVDALDALDLSDRTVVVFLSDNGGLSTSGKPGTELPTSNAPLRAGKGWLYEGGTRAPLVVRVPGLAAGMRVDVPVTSMDLYPTTLALAGLALDPEQHRDGADLSPLLRGETHLSREALYWHFPHYHGSGSRPSSAVRAGDEKLIEWLEDGTVELYDLAADPGEHDDLAAARPERAAALRGLLARWRERVGAAMPARDRDRPAL